MYVHCSEKNGNFVSPWQKIVSLVRISVKDTPQEDVFCCCYFGYCQCFPLRNYVTPWRVTWLPRMYAVMSDKSINLWSDMSRYMHNSIIIHCLAFAWYFYTTPSKGDAERELACHQCSGSNPEVGDLHPQTRGGGGVYRVTLRVYRNN